MTNKGKGLQLGGARCPESGPFPVVNEASFPFPDRMALNGVLLMEARGHLRGRVWFESVTRTETGCLRNSGRLRGRVRFFREKPMERATVHVLVVDDIEQWRDAACTMVHSDPRFFVVGVASDGAEAVRKAKALPPNIVLLDMNLPDLHGIEVARIIAEVSSLSRIIFLTQDHSSDLIEEGFRAGASGYVVKSSAARDLMPALSALSYEPMGLQCD